MRVLEDHPQFEYTGSVISWLPCTHVGLRPHEVLSPFWLHCATFEYIGRKRSEGEENGEMLSFRFMNMSYGMLFDKRQTTLFSTSYDEAQQCEQNISSDFNWE